MAVEAQYYLPASRFVAPRRLPRPISASETAIADLRGVAGAWELVCEQIPFIEAILASPAIQPHLHNFSLRTLAQFGMLPRALYERAAASLTVFAETR